MKHFTKYKKQRGYTIIETMIAITLFIVIVMMGMGALLNANLIHNKAQNIHSILDNLNFVMDDMSRNLRTGYNYHCFVSGDTILGSSITTPKSCANGWAIAFEPTFGNPATSDQWVYAVDNQGRIQKSTDGGNTFIQLTPDTGTGAILVSQISGFSVLGAEPPPGDTQQPFATIRLVGTITYQNTSTPFSIQTSVSQRVIDNVQ